MQTPAESITPVIENSGFTLVEEDDVAFSLSLCREINRIYGSYQSGDLDGDESVHLGLALTAQILSSLSQAVSKGMPALRIEVAWAQTTEMMAVMFGESIVKTKGRSARRQLEVRPAPAGEVRPAPQAPAIAVPNAHPRVEGAPASGSSQDKTTPDMGAATGPPQPGAHLPEPHLGAYPPFKRWLQWASGQSAWTQLVLGAVACLVTSALIDLPIVLLLLFSDLAAQLSTVYALAALAIWWAYRRWHHRLAESDPAALPVPSSNPLSWGSWNGKASPTCTAR